jgi:hypothetical protein
MGEVGTIAQVRALSAPAKVYLWELVVPEVPGSGADQARNLTLRARNAVIPGITNMTAKSFFKGQVVKKHPSRREFPGTMVLRFEEGIDASIVTILNGWNQLWLNDQEGTGEGQDEFLVNVFLRQLDHNKNVIASYKVFDFFPEIVPDVALNYEGSELVHFEVTFGYSYWILEE